VARGGDREVRGGAGVPCLGRARSWRCRSGRRSRAPARGCCPCRSGTHAFIRRDRRQDTGRSGRVRRKAAPATTGALHRGLRRPGAGAGTRRRVGAAARPGGGGGPGRPVGDQQQVLCARHDHPSGGRELRAAGGAVAESDACRPAGSTALRRRRRQHTPGTSRALKMKCADLQRPPPVHWLSERHCSLVLGSCSAGRGQRPGGRAAAATGAAGVCDTAGAPGGGGRGGAGRGAWQWHGGPPVLGRKPGLAPSEQ
jgi:hypothetical protein